MTTTAPGPERLLAQLDGARYVRYDPDGFLIAYFGGHGLHVYAADGTEVSYLTVGDFSQDNADMADVEAAVAELLGDHA